MATLGMIAGGICNLNIKTIESSVAAKVGFPKWSRRVHSGHNVKCKI